MNIIAINGSPRTNHNTGALLRSAARGATSKGATVEIIDLYKLSYKGCIACFSCKRRGSGSLRNCAVKDDLTPVLDKVKNADALILASPIYFYDLTGEMRCFLERLLFPYLPYDITVKDGTYFPRAVKTAFIYTMGMPEGTMNDMLKPTEDFLAQIFRLPTKTLHCCGAYPFVDDYIHYEASDLSSTMKHREEAFPAECEKAFALGAELAGK